jgi:hypothetical protein
MKTNNDYLSKKKTVTHPKKGYAAIIQGNNISNANKKSNNKINPNRIYRRSN